MAGQERFVGRLASMVALGFGAVYLGWRITSTMSGGTVSGGSVSGGSWWLSATTLAIEVVGFLAVALWVWALWRAPVVRAAESVDAHVEVIVRCAGSGLESLRATVLAARHLGPISVLDLDARPEVAALALDMGVGYLATDADDLDGLEFALEATRASTAFLLAAGDIPRPDVLDLLLPWLDDPSVAVVQGLVVSAGAESAEHGSGGRHDKEFERFALNPALGARGLAHFTGSGALLRSAPVRAVKAPLGSTPMVEAAITAGLFAGGWQIVAPGGAPVVAADPIAAPHTVETERSCEASGARLALVGPHGALRPNSLSPSQRLALAAYAVRPLGGIRRTAVIVVLLGSLLSGVVPINGTVAGFATLWMPWFVLAALGLWALSDGALRPGDRVRASMRVLGASWRGVMAPNGRPDEAKHTLAGAFGLHHGAASAAAVAAIGVVVGLRAISDRFTHTLAPMDSNDLAALLTVSLWSLGGGLDALRLLARRAQARRATRVVASLPSTIADRGAIVVDLTPLGAGVLGELDLDVGSTSSLDVVVPTATGCVSASLAVVVRNRRTDLSGEQRIGVEFGAVEAYEAEALAEFCIVQPALEVLGVATVDVSQANVRPVTVLDDHVLVPRRIGLRAAALVAVFGALSSSVPTSADASGAAVFVLRGDVVVAVDDEPVSPSTISPETSSPDATSPETTSPETTSPDTTSPETSSPETTSPEATSPGTEGAVVTAVCSVAPGADGAYGTSDDTYGPPVSDVVGADGAYSLALDGEACWYSVAPPPGFLVSPDASELESLTAPHVIDLAATRAPRVEIRPAVDPAPDPGTDPGTETALLADVVWADLDGDRVVDAGEPLLAGVTITVYDARDAALLSATTGVDGSFSFEVNAGSYRLGVSNLPAGYSAGPAVTGPFGRTAAFDATATGDVDLSIGLVPTVAVEAPNDGAAEVPTRLMAEPLPSETAPADTTGSNLPGLLVVLFASIIGFSVVAGSLRPGRIDPRRLGRV